MFGWVVKGTKKAARGVASGADMPMLKKSFGFIQTIFVGVFKRESGTIETFDEAVERLKLTPEALAERKKIFKVQMLIYALGAVGVGAYTVYLMVHGHWYSVALSFLIVVFLVVSTLRSHFWIFQIKQRKLGCTLQEWLNASIKES